MSAIFHGEGSKTNQPLLVRVPLDSGKFKSKTKQTPQVFVDARVDMRADAHKGQLDPHLVSKAETTKDGQPKTYTGRDGSQRQSYNTREAYNQATVDQWVATAREGGKAVDHEINGRKFVDIAIVGSVMGLNGGEDRKNSMIRVDSKAPAVTASSYDIDEHTMDDQMKLAGENRTAFYAKKREEAKAKENATVETRNTVGAPEPTEAENEAGFEEPEA